MSVMAAVPTIDPRPVFELIEERGECTFGDAMNILHRAGVQEPDARDVLWRLLSDGALEFTADRHLRLPRRDTLDRAAG